jgi:hypothetical protein
LVLKTLPPLAHGWAFIIKITFQRCGLAGTSMMIQSASDDFAPRRFRIKTLSHQSGGLIGRVYGGDPADHSFCRNVGERLATWTSKMTSNYSFATIKTRRPAQTQRTARGS